VRRQQTFRLGGYVFLCFSSPLFPAASQYLTPRIYVCRGLAIAYASYPNGTLNWQYTNSGLQCWFFPVVVTGGLPGLVRPE
jgi:hypothetical protein